VIPALEDGLDDCRLVEENYSRLGMPGVQGIIEVAEVDVGHSLVGFKDHADADVAVLLVLAVQRVSDDVIAGFGVQRTDAQNFELTRWKASGITTTHFKT